MPGSIPFESFLAERSCSISLRGVDSAATMTWFLEGGLRPTDQARLMVLNPLFTEQHEANYREMPELSLVPLLVNLEVRAFLREVFCWHYQDEKPTVERLQRILRGRGLRLLRPLEMLHVLWSRPWEQGLFGGAPHFNSLVALQEVQGMDEALIFRFRGDEPIRPLAFDVHWDDFCCMRDVQPQTILYTKR